MTAWLAKSNAAQQTSEKSQRGGHSGLKKIKEKVGELGEEIHNRCGDSGKVRLMFQDEAGFGRINKPKFCWCPKGIRPSVPCHHIREYRYAYGAVEPITGESCFLIMPYCNTVCMNLFLRHLAMQYPDDIRRRNHSGGCLLCLCLVWSLRWCVRKFCKLPRLDNFSSP